MSPNKISLLLIFSFLVCFMNFAQKTDPAEIIQKNLDAYNKRDIDEFMASFKDSIALYSHGKSEPIAQGKDAVRSLYQKLFEASPELHSTILHRAVIGNQVIDHESITGRKGSSVPVEMVMIYEVSEEHIIRMTVVKE
ncbi:MAG: nuclear transport factor 2 family protein [Cryomorphaceae bacterium]|nr:nuclear transport factor 2 family protein [Cryomorphaceae bacterium]